jgi:hypothetical protein
MRSSPCTWRRGARVSWLSLETKVNGLSAVWPQNYWDNFLWFGLKTGGVDFLLFGIKTGGNGFLWFCLKTGDDDFLRFGLKTGGDGFLRFGLKTGGDGFSRFIFKTGGEFIGLASKPSWCRISWFGSQNRSYDLVILVSKSPRWFLGVSIKIKWATVYRLRHKTDRRAAASIGLLHVKASRVRVFQPDLKTDGCAMAGGVYDTIAKIASSPK